jgi:hypothetical protein
MLGEKGENTASSGKARVLSFHCHLEEVSSMILAIEEKYHFPLP